MPSESFSTFCSCCACWRRLRVAGFEEKAQTAMAGGYTALRAGLPISKPVLRGQSGSPLWIHRQGQHVLVGIHTTRDVPGPPVANTGIRITPKILADIRRWSWGRSGVDISSD